MNCLKVHTIKRKRIDGMKIKDFIESCEDTKLYLLDIDPYFGREMNFKVYRELSGIFDIWIDSAPRKVEDVIDALVSDAEVSVITGVYMWDPIEEIFKITENVAMKSIYPKHISSFLEEGGEKVIVPKHMAREIEGGEKYVMQGRGVCPWKS